jgi:hypothetical protein
MHKPMRVASGHLLGRQEWVDSMRVASEDARSQDGGDYDVSHRLRIGMCLYV